MLSLIDDWPDHAKKINAIACCMIGAREGWVQAVYKMVPSQPFQVEVTVAPVKDPRLNLFVIPGLVQLNPSEDVMRGEETQISSFLLQNPNFDGVIRLPGTHTKWVHVIAGEIASFLNSLTGELFSLICNQSVLCNSLTESRWDKTTLSTRL